MNKTANPMQWLVDRIGDGVQWICNGGFRKPVSPYIATVECEPGKTTLRLTRNGEVFALVVLAAITRNQDGTSAVFMDPSHFMEKMRGDRGPLEEF